MKKIEFDVFVIGSGIAGQTAAKMCASEGLRVAITDNREYGGTCANRGCDPKKVLLGPTEIWEAAKNLQGKGISDLPKLDWKKLQQFKRKFTHAVPKAKENELNDLGISLYHQSPKFLDENTLSVEGKTITAKKIVIATGQVSRQLKFLGNGLLKNSDDFLRLKKLPKSIIFVGAGYVGMELAHMAARAGVKVTIIENRDSILKAFDKHLAVRLIGASEELGVRFIFNAEVLKVKKLQKNYRIRFKIGAKNESVRARMIFNTAGRVPAIAELNLEKGNVKYSEKGIQVNSFLQNPGNSNVYACGDVSNHGVALTPLSSIEASVVAENIIHGNRKKIAIPVVPSVVFTLPNLASVGLSEDEAKKRYKNVIVNHESVPYWYNAKRINTSQYAYKVIINQRSGKIVGAHILGPHAAETINLFAMAMNQNLAADALKNMIFTYPSWASDIKSML